MSPSLPMLLAAAYVALGILLTVIAYRLPKRLPTKILLASFVCALFFSVSIIVWRIVVIPYPTLAVLILLIADQFNPNYDPTGDNASVLVAVPFLIQWAAWLGIFILVPILKAKIVALRSEKK
jgi:hypothetical protein